MVLLVKCGLLRLYSHPFFELHCLLDRLDKESVHQKSLLICIKIYILSSDMVSNPPPGTDLENHGSKVNRIAAIFTIVGTSAEVARLISRKLQKSNLHASDYTIMLGLLVAWGQAALIFTGIVILLLTNPKR